MVLKWQTEKALKVLRETRLYPGIILTRLQLADMLLDHCEEERIEELEPRTLPSAKFRERKMQPSLEGASKHKEIQGAWRSKDRRLP